MDTPAAGRGYFAAALQAAFPSPYPFTFSCPFTKATTVEYEHEYRFAE
jgi:hypothetical protein